MAADPRFNFSVKSACDRSQNAQQKDAEKKKGFFDNLGSNAMDAVRGVAGVELFQGPVADGLRSLVGLSDAIRSGDTTSAIITNGLRDEAGKSLGGGEEGANVVLEEVGISPNEAVSAGRFNPGVVNRGTAEAQSVYDRVKQGNFKAADIPGSFQNLQNLKTLVGGIYTPGAGESSRIELCGAVPYARALIRLAPKYKFLFIVQFTFKPEYTYLQKEAARMAFVVKSGGRPNINIEHEEVNMYNFHTRIAKRTAYEPITMRFIDDQKGNSHYFMNHYLRVISPISKLKSALAGTTPLTDHRYFEDNGMSNAGDKTASITKLKGNVTSLLDEVRVFHLFDNGKKMSAYSYANPKILSMNFDDLDMAENGNGSEIEIQFAYDRLHIIDTINIEENQTLLSDLSGGGIDITDLNIVPVFKPGNTGAENGGDEESPADPTGETLVEGAENAKETITSSETRINSFSSPDGSFTSYEIAP